MVDRRRAPRVVKVVALSLALSVALAGCGRHETIEVDGKAVPVRRFTKAVAALCLARQQVGAGGAGSARSASSASSAKARVTYLRGADRAILLAVRALGPQRQHAAGALAQARERVRSDFAARPRSPALVDDLGVLVEAMRAGLARLSIPTRPCRV